MSLVFGAYSLSINGEFWNKFTLKLLQSISFWFPSSLQTRRRFLKSENKTKQKTAHIQKEVTWNTKFLLKKRKREISFFFSELVCLGE